MSQVRRALLNLEERGLIESFASWPDLPAGTYYKLTTEGTWSITFTLTTDHINTDREIFHPILF